MNYMNAKECSRKSFDKQAATYDIDINGVHARQQYNHILKKIEEFHVSSLLDVGCGTGEMLRLLLEGNSQIQLTGIDISEKMIEKARHKLEQKVCLVTCDSEKLPFEDNSFELVMCNDSFHHYPAPMKVLAEFYRVMKPEGILLISDFCVFTPIRQLMNFFIKFSHDGDVRIYSKEELLEMLQENSFKRISYNKTSATGFIVVARK